MAKVVRFHEFGGPEVLRLEEVTFEEPAPGELRLKVGAIGLNRREVVYRSVFSSPVNLYCFQLKRKWKELQMNSASSLLVLGATG